MGTFSVKVYVVQKFDRQGNPGEVITAKLTYSAAHTIAKANAPAAVLIFPADKTTTIVKPGQY